MNRDRCAAPVARLALLLCFVLASQYVPGALGQYGRSRQGYVKTIPYTYDGQQFTIITYGDQPAQVKLGTQIVLIVSN